MEDKDIIDLYFARDESALEETSKKYGAALSHISKNILKDVHEAGECFNDTLLAAWNHIPPEKPNNLFAYLAKTIRYISFGRVDYHNAQKRNANLVELSEEIENHILQHVDDNMRLEGKEISRVVSVFLKSIKYEHRIIFVRRYWYGDTITVIAEMMHTSEGKIKSVLFRTRNKLKEYLEKEGISI